MADPSRSPDDEGEGAEAAGGAERPGGSSKLEAAALSDGKLPPIPEARRGVISGVSKSSAPPPTKKDLPTLAPPRRRGADEAKKAPDSIESEEIDIELDTLLSEGREMRPSSRPPPSEQLPAICMYGRYEVLGRIAFGGMAEIFLGRETTSVGASRYLVIKRILPHVADDEQFVEMFLDEARLAIQLNHPNICHIYEFGELEDSYFIAMEWVNGVPLGKLIRKARLIGGIPPEIAVRVIAWIAEALDYAHNAKDALGRKMKIVHRDVSPHNIMVAYDGQVKLLDFGIAKATTHASKTEAGVVKGKFSYMAPEQCLGKPIDGRVDVFALGICLYETLTGKSLYNRDNEYETMRAVINEPPPSIREVAAHLPEELDAIVLKALAKDRDDRYATAGEMQAALERWLADSRKVVNAARVSELMDELYEEQIKRGPLVDSTPFGQSFQRRKKKAGPDESAGVEEESQPAASGASQTTASAEVVPPASRSPWAMIVVAATLLVVGLGAGYLLFYRPQAEVEATAASEPTAEGVEEAEASTEEAAEEAADPSEAEPEPEGEEPAEAVAAASDEEADEEPEPEHGSLRLTSTPGRARVRVDGERVEGTTPMLLSELSPGEHHLVVERAGYRSWEGDVEVVAGEQATAAARLSPVPREPAAPPGRLSINTRPWSKVYVGRRLLGTTPIAEAEVPSGAVRMRLVDRDGQTHTKTVRVAPGDTERVFFDLGQ